MPLIGCSVPTLVSNSSCFACLNDSDLHKAQVRYRELIYANRASATARTAAQVLKDSVAWSRLTAHQLLAIDVAQLANDAVILGAATAPTATTALAAVACYCGAGGGDIAAANEYLKCLIRNLG